MTMCAFCTTELGNPCTEESQARWCGRYVSYGPSHVPTESMAPNPTYKLDERKADRRAGEDRRDALSVQVGGDHYKKMAIQPVEFIRANNIGYFEGNVIKYVCRHQNKDGLRDLKKARHYLDMLIEWEEKKAAVEKGSGQI
jgi:hypothetical protein